MPTAFIFEAIGTRWQIDIPGERTAEQEARLLACIHERIARFDETYSRFRADSLVTKMSQQAGAYALPTDAFAMLSLYEDLYKITNGAVTPLIGQVLVDAGYDAEYSLRSRPLHQPSAWNDVIAYTAEQITLQRPALLDFGAAGKGYLIDLVGELLEQEGITSYCIDAGGDMVQRSSMGDVLRVGLEHPLDTTLVVGVATISNQSLCGSAGNRRAWGEFHHVIDPHSLTSPRHILATWVVAHTTLLADALATCLFFVSPELLAVQYDFSYCVIFADQSAAMSPNFPGELFT